MCVIVLVMGINNRLRSALSIMPMVIHMSLGLQGEDGRSTRGFLQEGWPCG